MILIKNGHIKTMAGADLLNGSILLGDDGKIAAIGENLTAPQGAEVIDAAGRLVTPGLVEAHCHIGLKDYPSADTQDFNEKSDIITPQVRVLDSFNPQCPTIQDALRGGLTTVCTGPGSSNVICGNFAVLKLAGKRVDDMIVKYPAAMKCALGENPKNAGLGAKKAGQTRMGVAAVFREFLYKAKKYYEDKQAGKDVAFDLKLEAMVPVFAKEIPLKVHAHRADDIFTAIRIAKEFDLKLTIDHCTDGALIAEELAQDGYPIIAGPFMGSRSKEELKHKGPETAAALYKAGNFFAITTDASVVQPQFLGLHAGLCVSKGLPMEEAWKCITVNPAKILGVENRVGSLEVGKDADVVIWTADPLTVIGAKAAIAVINGKVVWQL